MKPHEIFISDVKDENVQFWSYNQGDNRFIDNAILLIPDDDRSLFKTSPIYNAANYLYKDVKIKNDFDEVGEYIAFRGRINAPPAWQQGFVVITIEGYMAQYRDKNVGEYITVEDIETGEFTGYISAYPTSARIQDSGKSWDPPSYDNHYCLIHAPLNIPSTEWFHGIDWRAAVIDVQIQASADDAWFNDPNWNNNDNGVTGVTANLTTNGYMRFPINIPAGATVSNCDLHYHHSTFGAGTITITLINLDDCPAFPNVPGDESGYPVTGTTESDSFLFPVTWQAIDITTLLQAFIDRPGYIPGSYIGIKITSNDQFNCYARDHATDEAGFLRMSYTAPDPTDLDFIINDTINPDILELTGFDTDDNFIIGHPYSISKLTSDIVEFMIDTYSDDEVVSKDIETSTIGMIKTFVWGNKPFDVMTACVNTDNFRMRLKNDLEFMYRQFSTIANAGTIPEEIIEKKFRANNPPSLMVNLATMKDVYGRLVTRGWNYTTHAPQDDVVTALPADYPQRELFVPGVRYGGTTVCKSILDTYLYLYAEPESEENISVELNEDLNFQPGQIVDLPFRGATYSDYYITRKSYNEATKITTLRLVAT